MGLNAHELADFIKDFIFAEKETILSAYENEDEEMLADEIYEYIQNCN